MIKSISIGDILSAHELLNNFVKKDVRMPGKLSWIICDNMEKLQTVVDKFQKKHQQIGQKFISEGKTTKNEDGNDVISSEFTQDYANCLKEILEITRDIEIEMIPVDELRQIDNLSVMDIKALNIMTERQEKIYEKDSIG